MTPRPARALIAALMLASGCASLPDGTPDDASDVRIEWEMLRTGDGRPRIAGYVYNDRAERVASKVVLLVEGLGRLGASVRPGRPHPGHAQRSVGGAGVRRRPGTASPELGTVYVGSTGDAWDAQHDMAAALFGSLICLAAAALARRAGAEKEGLNQAGM